MAELHDVHLIRNRTEGDERRRRMEELRNRSNLPPQRSPIRIVKAGTISDADFLHPPPDYVEGIDTTNLRRYIKVGGVWRYSNLT